MRRRHPPAARMGGAYVSCPALRLLSRILDQVVSSYLYDYTIHDPSSAILSPLQHVASITPLLRHRLRHPLVVTSRIIRASSFYYKVYSYHHIIISSSISSILSLQLLSLYWHAPRHRVLTGKFKLMHYSGKAPGFSLSLSYLPLS